ncbi:hybrid sensor histidine kinase/response regulator transcription factor [Hymenobacter convexus]|uniref:hybrid sensor histidine kinase/response regulator transcription factor n=1 Tax=Hymenobacter sp. CA1UV-4 TaxID=3063782 RepID=UPI002712D370|nr:two-component regulator propeller domain-containing protein [Hymenobacter sp. CA1UV-4]MDO7849961.1 two-component regulator propeller domain-containing protein [Hymenobacter sp. CA1UV-4]
MKAFACWQFLALLLLPWWPGLAPAARAQDTAPSEFRFEHLTVDQGLSHSDAMAVAQDQAGFIWVGTNRGLDRYDGYGLKQYTLPINPRNGISGNRISALLAAPDGRLWVGTERAGLGLYDAAADRLLSYNEQQVPAPYRSLMQRLSQTSVNALTSDKQGRLWVGTSVAGVFVLSFDAQGRLNGLRQVPRADQSTDDYQVSSLATDAEGKVWIGTFNHGLRVVRPESADLRAEPTDMTERVRVLHLDSRGDLWIGTNQQVWWVSAANRRTVRQLQAHPQAQTYPQLQSIRMDSFHRLWVGTIYGLYVWEAGAVTGSAPPLRPNPTLLLPQDNEPFGINSERVHQIFEDRNQIMWLCASAGGLNQVDLRQKPFGRLRQQLSGGSTLANNYINAVYKEEATNILWSGTRNGVYGYDLTHKTTHSYLNQQWAGATRGVDVSTIFQSRNGALWFGTRTTGLSRLTRAGGRETLTTYEQLPGGPDLRSFSLESLAEDRFGTLWAASFTSGLLRLSTDGKFLGAFRQENSALPTNRFTYLLYDRRQDVLWASTADAGLLKLRVTADSLIVLKQFKQAAGAPDGLRVNYVWPLLLDDRGTLWIGTIGGGLHQLTTDAQGNESIHSLAKYLPESDVESILADDEGHLWIGGTGLYRYKPATRQYLRYDVADGLQSNAFKIGAAARAQDGTLYFGGINGISYFQPHAIQPNPYPPVVQLTGLRIANQPVAVGQPLNGRVVLPLPLSQPQTVTIKASENDFSVEFVGLNYANPQKNRYAYRLVGYNENWVYPAPGQRTASFANLPPGQYTFEVKASNGEGAWSKKAATVRFDVRAPWYKTGWAYGLYALVLLGAVALYRRIEMAQQRLKNRVALEQFQTEKEKELTGLKLGFFTNVSHELRTPLTLILGPMEEIINSPGPVAGLREKVELMHKQTRKLLDLVNQLLDFRKVETGNVPLRATPGDAVAFITDIYPTFSLKARERGVKYVLDLPTEPVPLYFDRSKLEIILTNLLANAFKYTRTNGRVELLATPVGNPGGEAVYSNGRLTGNYLKVTVADNGVGIKYNEIERIFDPYYQASHTNTLRMTGTGIGLSLARQFAERHGGQLTATSGEGLGTTFELRLPFGHQHLRPEDIQEDEPTPDMAMEAPIAAEPEPAVAEEFVLPNAEPSATRQPRLLVVEDHDEVRQYIRQLFEAEYDVITAEDGLEGWDKALAQLPDLVISDVMMPRSDGLELCQKIKQHPKTAHIPVLLLTARTAETHELEGIGMGADEYMSKPFNPTLLYAKADALLRNRRKLHEYYQRHILLEPTEIVVADADRQFLESAMAVVERNLDNSEFSVQVLVKEMAMSQSVFYRRIKSITGQTAVEFIRDVRMKRAAQLLAQTQMRVSEVAFEVGIEDAKYFRKAFQKIYNVSPSEYAKQHRPGREPAASAAEDSAVAP